MKQLYQVLTKYLRGQMTKTHDQLNKLPELCGDQNQINIENHSKIKSIEQKIQQLREKEIDFVNHEIKSIESEINQLRTQLSAQAANQLKNNRLDVRDVASLTESNERI